MIKNLKNINAGDLNVSYFEAGSRKGLPVILLHGFPYDIHAYKEVAPLLMSSCRIIIPYLRGYGHTIFLHNDTLRSGQQAALGFDLLKLMDALKIDKAILGGYDWGGRAACIVAALYPNRCLGIVSCNGYNIQDIKKSSIPVKPETEQKLWYQYFFHSERGRNGLLNQRHDFIKFIWKTWSPTWNVNNNLYNLSANAFENPDFVEVVIHSYRHRFGLVCGDKRFEKIEKKLSNQPVISVPVITIDGDNDGVTGLSDIAKIKQKFSSHLKHEILPNIGHNVPQEDPKNFSEAILHIMKIHKNL